MQDQQDEMNPAQRELESALQSLSPVVARVDPVSAAFAAGGRAAWRRVWQVHSGVAAVILLCAGIWIAKPSDDHADGTKTAAVPSVETRVPAAQSVVILRRAVLAGGLDDLPAASVPAAQPLRINELF
jgi:hypothetical protein